MLETLPTDKTISHYRILQKLGAGGMGEVFLAEDSRLRRQVALKVLPENIASDEDRLLRFEREAFAASALNHPNILTIYEFGADGERHFLASEFVKGETLRDRLNRERLTFSDTLEIAVQIASALRAAHEAGIIHRDIKPENVMIRLDGIVKVLDFGLAKSTENKTGNKSEAPDAEVKTLAQFNTVAGVIMGTAAYMSPEQARGQPVDARTDIFSLGAVLYEMLTRRQPFTGETINHTIVAILEKEPPPLSQSGRDFPAEIEKIVFKTLAKDKGGRYESAKDLLTDFKSLQKRLEFEAELERSKSPNKNAEARTQIIKGETTANAETRNSIAVLPFANMSADTENEYFCDGLAEELLNALAKIEDLRVAARTSAFSFKNKNVEVSQIGNALNVNTVLEGSVRKSGNKLRITVQLVNAADGYHLWSERYDREMQDIFDVQDEITLAVVDALKLKLFGEEKAAILKRYTDNTEAYELYLKGRYNYNKYTPENWYKAIEYFEKATRKEPEYALAFAGIGFCYGALWYFGFLSPHEIIPKWRAVLGRALEIDGALADAHLSLASIHFYYDWNWAQTERDYRRAIEINPNSPNAHWRYGSFLTFREQFEQAVSEGKRALELDPLSGVVNFFMVRIYWIADRLDDALEQTRKMIELEPNFAAAYSMRGAVLAAKGMYREAVEALEKSLSLNSMPLTLSNLGAAYALAGKRDEAFAVLNQLLEMRERKYTGAFNIARVYAGLGDFDKAFEWLEKAVEERDGELVFFKRLTIIGTGKSWGKNIRQDPRYQDILRRVGLPTDETAPGKTTDEASEAQTAMLSPVATDEDAASSSEGEIQNNAAVPPDVRKVSDFPQGDSQLSGGYAANLEAQPQEISENNLSERHSLSAHRAAQPQEQTELSLKTFSDQFKNRKPLFIIGANIFLLAAIGFGYWFFSNRPTKQIESIAVLPFENASGNADVEYLSDGMTETLIGSLSQLPNLNVKARSSVFRYKGKETDAQTVGKELNVQAIVHGRVVQRGQDLTLYVELVDAATENVLWKDDYIRSMTNLVSLQSEIARDVSQKLKTKLSGADEQKLAKNYTQNAEAYQLYLKGRYHFLKITRPETQKAISYFQQAIEIDPSYALAYATLADAYRGLALAGEMNPNEFFPKAKAAAQKAIQIDDTLADAHAALGFTTFWYDWDWVEADNHFKRAFELDPNNADAHIFYANLLSNMGRHREALAEAKRARELDPLNLRINALEAQFMIHAGQTDEALARLQKTLELEPNYWLARMSITSAYIEKGMYSEAVAEGRKTRDIFESTRPISFLGYALAKSGKQAEARAEVEKLDVLSKGRYVSPYNVAMIYNGLDEREETLAWLERGYQMRDPRLTILKAEPKWNNLRDDPRFQDLLKRVGFPQ